VESRKTTQTKQKQTQHKVKPWHDRRTSGNRESTQTNSNHNTQNLRKLLHVVVSMQLHLFVKTTIRKINPNSQQNETTEQFAHTHQQQFRCVCSSPAATSFLTRICSISEEGDEKAGQEQTHRACRREGSATFFGVVSESIATQRELESGAKKMECHHLSELRLPPHAKTTHQRSTRLSMRPSPWRALFLAFAAVVVGDEQKLRKNSNKTNKVCARDVLNRSMSRKLE
jgi:hypothetical protein